MFTLTSGTVQSLGSPLTFANNLAFSSASTVAFSGAGGLTFNGAATLTGTDTITNSTTVTLGGTVSGTGALVHNGPGKLILIGSNTYSGGTTITSGTVLVTNILGSATGTAAVSVGAAGSAWDKIAITGNLTITATSLSPFTIDLTTLTLLNAPGNAANFIPTNSYSWVIASVTGAISGFTGDKFIVNVGSFTNFHPGNFSLSVAGSTLLLNYTAVPEAAAWGSAAGLALFAIAILRHRRA